MIVTTQTKQFGNIDYELNGIFIHQHWFFGKHCIYIRPIYNLVGCDYDGTTGPNWLAEDVWTKKNEEIAMGF